MDPGLRRRGRQFERICVWYLALRREILHVWLWDEWPGRAGPDCGVDIVRETHAGELWAAQAKAVAPNDHLRNSEIDSFLSESAARQIVHRVLLATKDHVGRTWSG
jgi:predicted helicase